MKATQKGSALITVVVLAATAVLLASALFLAGGSHIRRTEGFSRSEHAFFIAEAGIQMAAAELSSNPDSIDNIISNQGYLSIGPSLDYAGGTLNVSNTVVTGVVDTIIVASKGQYKGRTRVVEAGLSLKNSKAPPMNADGAVCIYGENTKIDVTGSATIDGADRDVPLVWPNSGAAGEGTVNTNLPAAPGAYSATTSAEINVSAPAQVIGNPDQLIGGGGAYTEEDYIELATLLIPHATYNLTGGVYGGNNMYGTRENPVVTVISGNSKFTGNADGVGVLIITAGMEIDFAGTFNFEGLIIVIGGGITSAGYEFEDKGNCTLLGSVACIGDELDMKLTGSSLIGYSSSALANLANLDLPPTAVSFEYWREIK